VFSFAVQEMASKYYVNLILKMKYDFMKLDSLRSKFAESTHAFSTYVVVRSRSHGLGFSAVFYF